MIEVKIINTSDNPLPSYETIGSAGMDMRANLTEPIVLKSLDRAAIPTGLFIELPMGYEAQVRPRSGMALKSGLSIPNSPGTVDSDYRGELKVIVVNLSKEDITIQHGDRIAQMIIAKYVQVQWKLTETISETDRGAGGFGSTGTK